MPPPAETTGSRRAPRARSLRGRARLRRRLQRASCRGRGSRARSARPALRSRQPRRRACARARAASRLGRGRWRRGSPARPRPSTISRPSSTRALRAGEISRVEVMFGRYRQGGASTIERHLLLPLDVASLAVNATAPGAAAQSRAAALARKADGRICVRSFDRSGGRIDLERECRALRGHGIRVTTT